MPDQEEYLRTHPFGTTGEVAGPFGYKVYTALLNQSGTSAPVPTVLVNTLGGTIVWTRTGLGGYLGTLLGAFPTTKTFVLVGCPANLENGTPITFASRNSNNEILIISVADFNTSDDVLTNTPIEIRVYF